jgi:hypothetical protein
MVTGADKDRLGALLGVIYALAALLTLVPAALGRGRVPPEYTDDQEAVEPTPTPGGVGST